MKNELLQNLDKLHTTPMGIDRIRRNLALGDDVKDVVVWCRAKIESPAASIEPLFLPDADRVLEAVDRTMHY